MTATKREPDLRADFVVVGSGIAGLRAALALGGAGSVALLTKSESSEGNTGWAQGGIAAAVGPDDSIDLHLRDTLAAGDGLCDETAVAALVEEGPAAIADLVGWGTRFDRTADGTFALGREAAHSVRRVLHVRDATGREIARALWAAVTQIVRPTIVEHAGVDAVRVRDGRCVGVRFADAGGLYRHVEARAVLLATGGAGQVFRETTNPTVATGDGIAIAWHAGAQVTDLEFVQFHPTALAVEGAPRFLLSEALRGEGARLVNEDGEPFMVRYDPAGDLAPRDRVARGLLHEAERTGGRVYLTMAHLSADAVHARFPAIAAVCREVGFDLARDRIPVSPAAHYLMGGIRTDLAARTSLPGLFAAGEAACTGVHGANRLASNSLLEGLVFGRRGGVAMRAWAAGGGASWAGPAGPAETHATPRAGGRLAPEVTAAWIRDLAWRHVGLLRDRDGLDEAVRQLESAHGEAAPDDPETAEAPPEPDRVRRSLHTVAALMARAARRREESRGGHYRLDFPVRDDVRWRRHLVDTKGRSANG
jgi:L-aspartate oxidase